MKTILIAIGALVLGLVIGFFVGRAWLERQWQNPLLTVTAAAKPDADPSPAPGSRVFRAMPLGKTRAAVGEFVKSDPVVMTVGSVGTDSDSNSELHLVLENKGACAVKSVEGVAYGFDATGKSVPLNRGGEHYVAFRGDQAILPKEKALFAAKLRYSETASLIVAHVDRTSCADGTTWARN